MPVRSLPKHVRSIWLANWLAVTPQTVRSMVRRGDLPPPIPIGRHLRWPASAIVAFARERGIELPEELREGGGHATQPT